MKMKLQGQCRRADEVSEFEECQESITKKGSGGGVTEKTEEDTLNHDREHAIQIQALYKVNVNAEKKSYRNCRPLVVDQPKAKTTINIPILKGMHFTLGQIK